jgi:hypothetical protein
MAATPPSNELIILITSPLYKVDWYPKFALISFLEGGNE